MRNSEISEGKRVETCNRDHRRRVLHVFVVVLGWSYLWAHVKVGRCVSLVILGC